MLYNIKIEKNFQEYETWKFSTKILEAIEMNKTKNEVISLKKGEPAPFDCVIYSVERHEAIEYYFGTEEGIRKVLEPIFKKQGVVADAK